MSCLHVFVYLFIYLYIYLCIHLFILLNRVVRAELVRYLMYNEVS